MLTYLNACVFLLCLLPKQDNCLFVFYFVCCLFPTLIGSSHSDPSTANQLFWVHQYTPLYSARGLRHPHMREMWRVTNSDNRNNSAIFGKNKPKARKWPSCYDCNSETQVALGIFTDTVWQYSAPGEIRSPDPRNQVSAALPAELTETAHMKTTSSLIILPYGQFIECVY